MLFRSLPGNDKGSWLVSARRTYYDLVASRVTDSDFPRFADVQAKVRYDLAPGRSLSFFGLRSRQAALLKLDDRSARGEFQDDTRNDLASVRLDQTIGSSAQAHTIVAYSNSASTFGANAALETKSQRSNAPGDDVYGTANLVFNRTVAGRDLSVRQETAWSLGRHLVEAGGEMRRFATELRFTILGDRNPVAVNGSSVQGGAGLPDQLASLRTVYRGGLWLSDRWQLAPKVAVEAGLRADRSGAPNDRQFSPRVTLLADLTPGTRLRGAIGRYTQSPGYEKLVSADYLLDLTGANAIPNAVFLTADYATVAGTNSLTFSGGLTNYNSNRYLSNQLTGGAVLNLTGAVNLSQDTYGRILLLIGSGTTNISGVVKDSSSTGTGSSLYLRGATSALVNLTATNTASSIGRMPAWYRSSAVPTAPGTTAIHTSSSTNGAKRFLRMSRSIATASQLSHGLPISLHRGGKQEIKTESITACSPGVNEVSTRRKWKSSFHLCFRCESLVIVLRFYSWGGAE